MIVSTAKPSSFDTSQTSLRLHPNEMAAVSVLYTPTAIGPEEGQLFIAPTPGLAYCDRPPAPIALHGSGTK